ncbi:unnamed protein product [Bathycoccus prasinos]
MVLNESARAVSVSSFLSYSARASDFSETSQTEKRDFSSNCFTRNYWFWFFPIDLLLSLGVMTV